MELLAFDGRTGAAGDMILGALVGAGADPAALAPVEDALGVEYGVGTVDRAGIGATRVAVRIPDDGDDAPDGDHAHDGRDDAPDEDHAHDGRDDAHATDHAHDDHDDHDHHGHHGHDHDHDTDHAEGAGPDRAYPEVVELVESMDLPGPVAEDALSVFGILAEAEAAVHDADPGTTRFHEVGADDAVADVVGAALLFDDLDPDRVVTAPLSAGGGEVTFSHGTYPVPAPATVEVAARADWELRGGPVDAELLTPTGAAILAHYAEGVESLPALRVEETGYGAGRRDLGSRPNVLRAIRGRARTGAVDGGGLDREGIAVLETNLDDAAPELLGGLQSTLAEAGALDVSVVPLTAKKSRPGHLVKVIARSEDAERVARRLAEETGTLGVRATGATHRFVADRRVETVTVEAGGETHEVDVKVGSAGGEVYDVSAEYDDAAAVASDVDLPIREVVRRAETAFREGDR